MNKLEEEQLVTETQVRRAEELRRSHERKSFDTNPIPDAVDYGMSGQITELALGHLRESIPNGQRERTEVSYRALMKSVELTGDWLRKKGMNV